VGGAAAEARIAEERVERYVDALRRRRPLPPERERALVDAAGRGDGPARAALVEAYMPRIVAVARHYRISPNIERAGEIDEEQHREPTHDELAERAGLSRYQVASLLAIDRPPRSLGEPLTTEDGIAWARLEDQLADPLADGEYERVLRHPSPRSSPRCSRASRSATGRSYAPATASTTSRSAAHRRSRSGSA